MYLYYSKSATELCQPTASNHTHIVLSSDNIILQFYTLTRPQFYFIPWTIRLKTIITG